MSSFFLLDSKKKTLELADSESDRDKGGHEDGVSDECIISVLIISPLVSQTPLSVTAVSELRTLNSNNYPLL